MIASAYTYAYVTTDKFLIEFGFESLRDLPDLEALRDAGLIGVGAPTGGGEAEAGDSMLGSEVSRDHVA